MIAQNRLFDQVKAWRHVDEAAFYNACVAAVSSATVASTPAAPLAKTFKLAGKLGNIVRADDRDRQELVSMNRPFYFWPRLVALGDRTIRLRTKFVFRRNLEDYYQLDWEERIVWMGYGSYKLPFHRNRDAFRVFYERTSAHGCNLHRSILFTREEEEGDSNVVPLFREIVKPKKPLTSLLPGEVTAFIANLEINPDFIDNLKAMAEMAMQHGVMLQLCMFGHHAYTQNNWTNGPRFVTRDLVKLGGTEGARAYVNFFHPDSLFMPLQEKFIKAVCTEMWPYWNVVFEVVNEGRADDLALGSISYSNTDLYQWASKVASLINKYSHGRLITTSSGTHNQNEKQMCGVAHLDYASFHCGQWNVADSSATQALARARSYGEVIKGTPRGLHLVYDDDGGSCRGMTPEQLKANIMACLKEIPGVVGQTGYNHKGPYAPWETDASKVWKHIEGGVLIQDGNLMLPKMLEAYREVMP